MNQFLDRIKSLFMNSTTYEYTETDTTISNGKITITRTKKTGDVAKAEFEKTSEGIRQEFKEFFR